MNPRLLISKFISASGEICNLDTMRKISKTIGVYQFPVHTYLDYIELFPTFSCSIPTITWFRYAEKRIPETFKENRKWDVTILKAPECPPTVKVLRLIKTAPFNFELRNVFQVYDP